MKTVSFFLAALVTGLFACNKTDFDYPEGKVGRSRIVYFPAVSIQGEDLVVLNQGEPYTEAGATATLNGQPIQYTTSDSVNTAVPGVYNLTYSAQNEEGNTASAWRTVVVIGTDVAANDFSGTYMRYVGGAPFGETSTWTKTGTGIYQVENPGGAATGHGYNVIAVNYQGRNVAIPQQNATDPEGASGVVSSSEAVFSSEEPLTYTWTFFAGGYGTAPRTFVKE